MSDHPLRSDKEWILKRLVDNGDLESRTIATESCSIDVLYLASMCDSITIKQSLIKPWNEISNERRFHMYITSFPGSKRAEHPSEAIEALLGGFVVLFIGSDILLFDAKKVETGGIKDAKVESVVQGPSDSFNENLETNINLLRRRYPSEDLKLEMHTIGTTSRTKIAIAYDSSRASKKILAELKSRLAELDIDMLQSSGELMQYLTPAKFNLFPTMLITERPDRTVKNIAEGKIALLLDTSGFAIILPSIFYDFFAAMDDKFQLPMVGIFLKVLRLMGLLIALTIPAFYVAFTSFNPEILKVQITLLIAGSRASVPYPSFVEVLFMLIMMEFLVEASLRLPKTIGPTATTVGGLILGQAATEAGLVGNIMIILVSAVAISNFIIPINMMNFSIRVIKYGFVLLASFLGLVGIVLGVIALIMYLSSLRSFGVPYFTILPHGNRRGDETLA
ncbi:spore germination protein [Paenibacillus sp. UNCCL117]|uniref:spore germination protein n=1 Tax=unclassified Paenibacillus TaxID=185978 RepID=UPI00088EF64C|nr:MULTISPECIES: spore germination protein [unclassified Paenibacillus]SDC92039.1 spore germination protein [Paenibacillus sp. cl123]SFW29224.1 spore germination protein [Paenibacillus sp. UNCCL117]